MGTRVNAEGNADMVLDQGCVYLTPLGKLCRFVPYEYAECHRSQASFQYVRSIDDAANRWGVGFSLTRHNWHLLQVVQS